MLGEDKELIIIQIMNRFTNLQNISYPTLNQSLLDSERSDGCVSEDTFWSSKVSWYCYLKIIQIYWHNYFLYAFKKQILT